MSGTRTQSRNKTATTKIYIINETNGYKANANAINKWKSNKTDTKGKSKKKNQQTEYQFAKNIEKLVIVVRSDLFFICRVPFLIDFFCCLFVCLLVFVSNNHVIADQCVHFNDIAQAVVVHKLLRYDGRNDGTVGNRDRSADNNAAQRSALH